MDEETLADRLAPFIGEWTMKPEAEWAPPDVVGRVTIEPMEGGAFLVQRWTVPVPIAPDGIAIYGPNEAADGYLQHYFDTRGVARVYQMSFDGRVWKMWRYEADFSPLPFRQRWTAEFSEDGRTIRGKHERTEDDGSWVLDFPLTYERVG